MFKIDVASTICTLRDAIFPASQSGQNADGSYPGIVFAIDARLSVYGAGEPRQRSAIVFVAMCGNTNVFVAVEPQDADRTWLSYREVPLDAWENTSNHDSCWRSDGLRPLSRLYFAFAEQINAELPEEKQIAPKDMHDNSSLGLLLSRPFELVQMKHEGGGTGSYRRALTSISPRDAIADIARLMQA